LALLQAHSMGSRCHSLSHEFFWVFSSCSLDWSKVKPHRRKHGETLSSPHEKKKSGVPLTTLHLPNEEQGEANGIINQEGTREVRNGQKTGSTWRGYHQCDVNSTGTAEVLMTPRRICCVSQCTNCKPSPAPPKPHRRLKYCVVTYMSNKKLCQAFFLRKKMKYVMQVFCNTNSLQKQRIEFNFVSLLLQVYVFCLLLKFKFDGVIVILYLLMLKE